MLVKKINPEWHPSENMGLQVGEVIDITDPKALVLNGDVIAVTPEGAEISGYELYGVLVGKEKEEFEEWLSLKRQKAHSEQLLKEHQEIKEQISTLQTEEKKEVKKKKLK